MYMVLFEAVPAPGREQEYFAISGPLLEELPRQPGFIRIDRAKSILTENKLLSISFWESEEAIQHWYEHPGHKVAQARGKQGIFQSMRITRLKVLSEREVESEG